MSKRSSEQAVVGEFENSQSSISSEQLTLSVISVMKEAYGALPEAFWGLSKSADLLAPRGFVIKPGDSFDIYKRRYVEKGRYPIVSLRIGSKFNEQITIIPGVKVFRFTDGEEYIRKLPNGEERPKWRKYSVFNQPLALPPGLEVLVLGAKFDQPLTLPNGLKELRFRLPSTFNHPITLPPSLQTLELSRSFNHFLDFTPLLNLEVLRLGVLSVHPVDLAFLPKLRVIHFGSRFNHPVSLPPTIDEVSFGSTSIWGVRGAFNQAIELPPRVQDVSIVADFDRPLGLPTTGMLRRLTLGGWFSQQIALPEGLECLNLGGSFDHPISIPSTLKELKFHEASIFNQPVEPHPQGQLKIAAFGVHMTYPVPLGLEELVWWSDDPVHLYEGLQSVMFGRNFQEPLILPQSLRLIYFHSIYEPPLVLPPECERVDMP